jgi:phage-related protein (TIGR01555 family)
MEDLTGDYRELYFNYWEAKKIIEIPVNDALRRKYKIVAGDADKEEILRKKFFEYSVDRLLRECLILERLDGGCAIFVGYAGSGSLDLAPKKNAKIEYLRIINLDKLEVRDNVPEVSGLGNPDFRYRVNNIEVHEDRLIFFLGSGLPVKKKIFSNSVLRPIKRDICHAVEIRERVARIAKKTSCAVATTNNFVTSDATKVMQLKEALTRMTTDQAVIIDGDNAKLEEFSSSFSDLSELINTYLKVLASALDIPVTRFLGLSNSGLTQSSDGDLENYYNLLQQLQQTNIRIPLLQLLKIFYVSIFGADENTGKLDIEFPSLWNNSEEEEQKIKEMKLNLIIRATESGLLSADEGTEEINNSGIFASIISKKGSESEEEEFDE